MGARPYRVQGRVARCDMGLPAHTSHPLSRLFACFAGPIPQAKRGRDRNPIPDRSSCPLRPSVHLLFLHCVPVGDGFPEAKRDASPPWTSRTLRARHSSLQARRHADTASFVVALPSHHSWLLPIRQLCRGRACLGCLLHLFQSPGPDIIDVTIDRNPLRNERVLADAPDVVNHACSRILER
jgi:hypothetical protein